MSLSRRHLLAGLAATGAGLAMPRLARAQQVKQITVDFATYNPLSLIIRDQKLLEEEFRAEGIAVRWVQTLGSNKALEFLNAGSLDFGSTAGAAALIGRLNGNPIRSVGVYSQPEWTALVTKGEGIASVADLKGKAVAVTRGTDPHIFLIRALAEAGLKERDVRLVLLQHPDGKTALIRGDVQAWAGLDPMMAAAEIEDGARLFFRKPENNTWGILNVREEFAARNPEIVQRVLAVYERARKAALASPKTVVDALVAAARLPEPVIARQLERTGLPGTAIGDTQAQTIVAAGLALQEAGVIKADQDVKAATAALIDGSFAAKLKA